MRTPPADSTIKECRSHCAVCGSHFSGDEAFDLHRRGSYKDGERYCEEPEDATHQTRDGQEVHSLEVAQENGRCLLGDEPKIGVTIWRKARPDVALRRAA